MAHRPRCLNRELSWLDFNARVLGEALDTGNPLLERLKFLAIFSNNLDEFFMVRVAGLRRQAEEEGEATDPSGMTAAQQMTAIRRKVGTYVARQYRCLLDSVAPGLRGEGVVVTSPAEWSPAVRRELARYFEHRILPLLTPQATNGGREFPLVSNRSIQILVQLRCPRQTGTRYALVEVPPKLSRFIEIRGQEGIGGPGHAYALAEDVITQNLYPLFEGCEVVAAFPFRITRDMDFTIDKESSAELLEHLRKALKLRRRREPIRLEAPASAPARAVNWLCHRLGIAPDLVYRVPGPLDLSGFFELCGRETRNDLRNEEWQPLASSLIPGDRPIFAAIAAAGAISLFHPFESFDPVVRLVREAADDRDVLAIKQTLYRVSGDSPIVSALQTAAQNGKQVTVIVEVKARFDEERNLEWARELEQAGAHVIYGIAGRKIHGKALLVIRREDGQIRRYLHLATGNYNDRTAKLYTDVGYLTTDPAMCTDVGALFNVMTGYAEPPAWDAIAVAPYNLRATFYHLIDCEARNARIAGVGGRITAKMNSLEDPGIITRLYAAARAGVQIDLIVRGLCCLDVGLGHGRIRVVSIVDRYLEHSRVFRFENAGKPLYFLSSADWMPRNLDRRFEILFPVSDLRTRERLDWILAAQLADVHKGRHMKPGGEYTSGRRQSRQPGSQELTYRHFAELRKTETALPEGMPRVLRSSTFHPRKRNSKLGT